MTTGTIGSPFPSPYTTGSGFYRTWSGTDGRTTTFAGSLKDKWNNYTCTIESWFVANLNFVISWRPVYSDGSGYVTTTTNNVGFGFQAADPWTSNDTLSLYGRLLDKVKSHDFDLGVNLGQLHQTVDLLSTNLSKLGQAALALKRGNFSAAARQLGARPRGTRLKTSDVSGRWLELQYGWLPLIGDSYQAAKAYEAISVGQRTKIYRSSYGKKWTGNGSQSFADFSVPYSGSRTRYIQYECTEVMGIPRQLGLLDPLSVAWELLPWSFVIDWFIPIGSYLDVLNQMPSLQGRFLTTEVIKMKAISAPPAVLPGWYMSGLPSYHKILFGVLSVPGRRQKKIVIDRSYSTTLPIPLPSAHLAGAIHGRRLWNAISLAQQRFARSFRL